MSKSLGRILAVALLASASAVPMSSTAAVAADVTEVVLDLRPGSDDKNLNLKGNPTLPVAILSTPSFDATTVLVGSVCFGDPGNKTQRDCSEEHGAGHPGDVDGDGDSDLLLHFSARDAGLDGDDARACLEGRTASGGYVFGCDAVLVQNGAFETEVPDLAMALLVEPTLAEPNAPVKWTATITNDGLGAVTVWPGDDLVEFTIPAGLTGAAVTAPAGYACTTGATAATCAPTIPDTILVGETRVFALSGMTPDAPGPLEVKAEADPEAAVVEGDETDNLAAATTEVQVPNFALAMTAVPAAASAGEPLAWKAVLTNTGPGSARVPANTKLLTFAVPAGLASPALVAPTNFSCSPITGGFACAPAQMTTITVGQSLDFVLTAVAPPGNALFEVSGVVDPDNLLPEADESDNVAKAPILVQQPNLIVTSVVAPELVGQNETVEWVATVANAGPGRARFPAGSRVVRLVASADLASPVVLGPAGFTCAASAPREYVCTNDVAITLNPGDTRVFRLQGQIPSGTTALQVVATADPANVVAEDDETDNDANSTATVQASDLEMTSVTVNANPVDAAHSVTWTANVTNAGSTPVEVPSGAVFLRWTFPTGMTNLFASTPAAFTCFIAATQTVDCATTAAVTIPAGAAHNFVLGGTAPRLPGEITTVAAIDPNNVIAEQLETNNSGSSTTLVQPPDFAISLQATQPVVDALGVSTWNVTITNAGPARARIPNSTRMLRYFVPAGMLNLAVSSPPNFTCFIETTNVVDCQSTATQTLDVGASYAFTMFGTVPRQPGDLTMSVAVDPLGVIPELDDVNNNQASTTITVQPPDLRATLTATPDPVDALGVSTWVARIHNDGPANARISTSMRPIRFLVPPNMINLAVSSPPNFTCFIEATATVDCQATATTNLASGAHLEFTMFGTAPRTPGPLSMTVMADPLGGIPEGDEFNNQATVSITVQPPDLRATLTATPDPVDALGVSTWVARIHNDGPANARISNSMRPIRFLVPPNMINLAVSSPPNFTCFIEATATVDCQATATTNLAAGAHLEFTLFGTAPRTPGPLTTTVIADPLGVIPEVSETNNEVVTTITVQPPDLRTTLTATPDPVDAAHVSTWVARIHNDGPANARISTSMRPIRFLVPPNLINLAVSSPPNFTCFIEATATIDCQATATVNLAAGAHLEFTLFGTAPRTAGPISTTVIADPLGVIPEVSETNNEITTSITVRVPDFSVAITAPDRAAVADAVSFTTTVTNNGPAVARVSSSQQLVQIVVPSGLSDATMTVPANWTCTLVSSTFECRPNSTVSIAVGGTVQFVLSGTASTAGPLTSGATADPLTVIPETNESNNASDATVTVS